MSPKVPTCRPFSFAPTASQVSSIMTSPCLRQKFRTSSASYGFPSVWAKKTAFVRSESAASSCERSALYVESSLSIKTGTAPFWMIGFTVVGNPAAAVMISSPGPRVDRPKSDDPIAQTARRLALDPEFTRTHSRTPNHLAKRRSNSSANRPVVSQKSSALSTRLTNSRSSKWRPETATPSRSGSNSRVKKAVLK